MTRDVNILEVKITVAMGDGRDKRNVPEIMIMTAEFSCKDLPLFFLKPLIIVFVLYSTTVYFLK